MTAAPPAGEVHPCLVPDMAGPPLSARLSLPPSLQLVSWVRRPGQDTSCTLSPQRQCVCVLSFSLSPHWGLFNEDHCLRPALTSSVGHPQRWGSDSGMFLKLPR